MPELPEVESARSVAGKSLVGRKITGVSTADDRIVYDGVSPRRFACALRGQEVLAARRKGKHMWLETSRRPWPLFHLGMGGRFYVYEHAAQRPRFWKVEIRTDEGLRVAMTNPRRLGRIRLREDPLAEPPISQLGPDPLLESLDPGIYGEMLGARKAPIKALLLDQGLFAGVGNWIADEVLYQARIDPRRRGSELQAGEVRKILRTLRRVLERAVAVDADSSRFPKGWLFHRRWGRDPESRAAGGEKLRFDTIGGRTTAWVPGRQG